MGRGAGLLLLNRRKLMNVRFLNCFKSSGHSAVFCLVAILAASFSSQQCRAQQSSIPIVSDPLTQINWATGPQEVHLGDFADMAVPSGYRMTDANGARILLESMNNPVPSDLVGLIAPATGAGKWWAVVEYDPKGYI